MENPKNQDQQVAELQSQVIRLERAVDRIWNLAILGVFLFILNKYGWEGAVVVVIIVLAIAQIRKGLKAE